MNQKNNNLEFNKSHNKNSNDDSLNNQNKRNVIIKKIMDKYGLSFHEANKIVIHLEQKEKAKNNSKGNLKKQVNNSNVQVSKPASNIKNVIFVDIGHSKTKFFLSQFKFNEFY